MHKKPRVPKRAKCPGCKKQTLAVEFMALKLTSYVLLDNGIEGRHLDTDNGDTDIGKIWCTNCNWEDSDTPDEFVGKLLGEER